MASVAQPPAAPAHHVFPLRVYYEDTDAAGIVYYANYLKFAERARTEMLRARGFDHTRLDSLAGLAFAVRSCRVDYLHPARLDDALEVHTRVTRVGGATLDADQDIRRDGTTVTRLHVRLACINRTGRPARLPPMLRTAFSSPS
ncbi:MAG: tol-pal system-associated acyl-CoA thioesterase [Alphaproteobacteria bacterium]